MVSANIQLSTLLLNRLGNLATAGGGTSFSLQVVFPAWSTADDTWSTAVGVGLFLQVLVSMQLGTFCFGQLSSFATAGDVLFVFAADGVSQHGAQHISFASARQLGFCKQQ